MRKSNTYSWLKKKTLRKQWIEGNFLPLKNTNCHPLITYLVNSKWILDLNIKHTTIELLEDIGVNLHDLGLGRVLGGYTKGTIHKRKKNDKIGFYKKYTTFTLWKTLLRKWKDKLQTGIFANHVSTRDVYLSRTQTQFSKQLKMDTLPKSYKNSK